MNSIRIRAADIVRAENSSRIRFLTEKNFPRARRDVPASSAFVLYLLAERLRASAEAAPDLFTPAPSPLPNFSSSTEYPMDSGLSAAIALVKAFLPVFFLLFDMTS